MDVLGKANRALVRPVVHYTILQVLFSIVTNFCLQVQVLLTEYFDVKNTQGTKDASNYQSIS